MKKPPKYSLIVPARNGGDYLKACIETIIIQEGDYELIISDDNSGDASMQYLNSLISPKIKVIQPTKFLSMAEHWEWALSHASGDWLMFIGQDDGLQKYFFSLADALTNLAMREKLRVIMSRRAYYFWPGCEFFYGDICTSYIADSRIKLCNSRWEAFKALVGIQHYFELPQMYTSSLFHRSLIEEARRRQQDKIFVSHPQDANLAAIACSLEATYLKSYIPLGWVGSSPKSAGMAVLANTANANTEDQDSLRILKQDYENKIRSSNIHYDFLAGEFDFGDTSIYFWQALLKSSLLRSSNLNALIKSKYFIKIIFASVLIKSKFFIKDNKRSKQFDEIIRRNDCKFLHCILLTPLILPFYIINRIITYLSGRIFPPNFLCWRIIFRSYWRGVEGITLKEASEISNNLASNLLNRVIKLK
ncbi:glycosyltransferase family 2 protein [Polynucleobacter paneuropaeus]|nr:glycosyltransferase family 2 protein [Polynucleobacter paneuropaeus]